MATIIFKGKKKKTFLLHCSVKAEMKKDNNLILHLNC